MARETVSPRRYWIDASPEAELWEIVENDGSEYGRTVAQTSSQEDAEKILRALRNYDDAAAILTALRHGTGEA